MKLAAVYNVWADCIELLQHSIDNIRPVVDGVIIVWSNYSNRGNYQEYALPKDCLLFHKEPSHGTPHLNELAKRNHGLIMARVNDFTHFIMMDSDEFYRPEQLRIEREQFEKRPDLQGVVHPVVTYFASPTLTLGYDRTVVPGIHRITDKLKYEFNSVKYPFTLDQHAKPRIDPTRRLNINSGVEWSDFPMHHYSWIRKHIDLKIENSSAKLVRSKEIIYRDLENAKAGYKCELYGKVLEKCENYFNIPEYQLTL